VTELFVQLNQPLADDLDPADLTGIAGLVVNGHCLTPGQCRPLPAPVFALTGDVQGMDAWGEDDGPLRIVDAGLEDCARLRDARPELKWLPRLVAYKPDIVYRMADYPGEGFRFYAPDTAAIQGYRFDDGDRSLIESLAQARSLGFGMLWLHARDAQRRGDGLDLDLLERAKRHFGDGLWISGGATERRHLVNLAREGGAPGLVIDSTLLAKANGEALTAALAPPAAPSPV